MMSKLNNSKKIAYWLVTTAVFVFAMAVIGAITRLTESGLSMTEWRPLVGTIPPLSEAEWQRVFDLYRETPEYRYKNAGMTLDEFKYIFFWEWFHRFWGRLIGLVYALPLLYFWLRGMIPQGMKPRLLILLGLGAAQAVMGWYMVMSGLVDRPSVSHYRLAAHLGLAFLIFVMLLKTALPLLDVPNWLKPQRVFETYQNFKPARIWRMIGVKMLVITIIWGAFVAGLDAGLIYNTFPLMGGRFFPSDAGALSPFIMNFFESHAGVQFAHRWLAMLTGAVLLGYALYVKHWALAVMVCVQVALGIATLLTHVAIPMAAMHQAGAFILIALILLRPQVDINAAPQKSAV